MNQLLYISEALINPRGSDAGAEWIELGNQSDVPRTLLGWSLRDASGKEVKLSGTVPARGYILLQGKELGLSLNNQNERLELRDQDGNLRHELSFEGSAKEGWSLAWNSARFVWSRSPTPRAANEITIQPPFLPASLQTPSALYTESITPFFLACAVRCFGAWVALKWHSAYANHY